MGSYLYGFIEQRQSSELEWRFVLPTSKIVGCDGRFFDMFTGNSYFPSINYTKGYPEDLSRETKGIIATDLIKGRIRDLNKRRITSEDLESQDTTLSHLIETMEDPHILDLGNYRKINTEEDYVRYFTYEDLEGIWDDEVLDRKIQDLKKRAKEDDTLKKSVERSFNLIRTEEQESKKLTGKWLKGNDFTKEEMKSLVLDEEITKNGKKYRLDRKKRRDAMSENWELIWNIMKSHAQNWGKDNVRMVTLYEL